MNKNKAIEIIEILKKYYPEATCSLDFKSPFELLVAVVLSAQCTDKRVNLVTPDIFSKYNTPKDFAKLDLDELEKLIHSTGFYKNKAKNLKQCSIKLVEEYNSIVPNTMEELIKLPGVGRKSANVILVDAYNICVGIAVDTHAKRVSNRLGFSKESSPNKIEQDLINLVPDKYLKDLNHLFVFHGRNTCTAQKPKCDICPVRIYCNSKFY